jgi:hypothetical protein
MTLLGPLFGYSPAIGIEKLQELHDYTPNEAPKE